MARLVRIAAMAGVAASLAGCSSITDRQGFLTDPVLITAIQPGIDNRQSVEGTLGQPTFASQFGEPTWYYVSSLTEQRPFASAKIENHTVLAVRFDSAGNVISADQSGIEKVVDIDPDGDSTPTLGRERTFLEDLFGNIGTVGAPGAAGPQQ